MIIIDGENNSKKIISRVKSVAPHIILGISVYIATMYLSGTEEPSTSCQRLPHKH